MLVHVDNLPDRHEIDADICIIGTGPAGITIARELMGTPFSICMLECGGQEDDPDLQTFNEGTIAGEPYGGLIESRYRRFGGTAHKWLTKVGEEAGARFVPLDGIDFEERPWLPYSGWPFPKEHLDPYYERAQTIIDLGAYQYTGESWASAERPMLPLAPSRFVTGVYQVSKGNRFREAFLDEIRHAQRITAYVNAFVTEIITEESGTPVCGVHIMSRSGKKFTARAKQYILAAGGIENARLLLNSDRYQSGGVGNENDLVGRFFMEHPILFGASLVPSDKKLFDRAGFYDIHLSKGTLVGGRIGLAETMMRQDRLLNSSIVLYPVTKGMNSAGGKALRQLIGGIRRKHLPAGSARLALQVIGGIPDILSFAFRRYILKHQRSGDGWSKWPDKSKRFDSFDLVFHLEQAPDPDSRITLSTDCDALGMRKVRVEWRFNPINRASADCTLAILADEVQRAGIGKLIIDRETSLQVSVHHHMGTTRMHRDPQLGVVDENCRVHGVENLLIAGSSVFPTGGFVNPTLTIIALAVRLADHVKQRLTVSNDHGPNS
jgi:choline dehydrogenase-like flavoprotein